MKQGENRASTVLSMHQSAAHHQQRVSLCILSDLHGIDRRASSGGDIVIPAQDSYGEVPMTLSPPPPTPCCWAVWHADGSRGPHRRLHDPAAGETRVRLAIVLASPLVA